MKHALLTIIGFVLLLTFGHVEPKHTHVDARLYFNDLKSVRTQYCPKTDMIIIQGEHHKTSYYVKY